MDDIAFLSNIETTLLRPFGDEWRIWSALAEVAPRALVSHQKHFRDRRHRFRQQLHLQMPTIRWGFAGTAVSESGVGGRENTKHKPNTFGATFAIALQNAATENKNGLAQCYVKTL
jgi:hypothetical protein